MRQCFAVAWLLCAWVLWQMTTPRSYEPMDGYETKRECDYQADRLTERMKGLAEQMKVNARYLCFPSGTDPRPRGKD